MAGSSSSSSSSSPRWSDLKKALSGASRGRLLLLLKDLFELSPENRALLAARFSPAASPALLETYRKRVIRPFYPARGVGKLDLAEGRRALREYEKATGDLRGTVDLMLSYVEAGTGFTHEYGDIDARFYDSLGSVLSEAAKRLRGREGKPLYPDFADRLQDLARSASDLGWGYGDEVADTVESLAEDLR